MLAPLEYSWTKSEAQVVEPVRDVNCADGDDIEIYDGQESMEIEVKISNGHENIAIINGGNVLPCFAVRVLKYIKWKYGSFKWR